MEWLLDGPREDGVASEFQVCREDPRQAVREHGIVCLVCGCAFRLLTNTHILSHGLTSAECKLIYGYSLRRPLMGHSLRRLHVERAVRTRLADQIRRRPIVEEPDLRRHGEARAVFLEELLTRREIQQRPRTRWGARGGRGRFVPRPASLVAGDSGEHPSPGHTVTPVQAQRRARPCSR